MKKIIFLFFCIQSFLLRAQAPPESFSFRAVAVDLSNNAVPNQAISVKFSILDGSSTGTLLYAESHSTTTDANGAYNLSIGGGVPITNLFTDITWESGPKYLKLELDLAAGSSYSTIGQPTQLLSVPYALYAKKAKTAESAESAESAANGVNMVDNIAALRELAINLPDDKDKIIYLKGYYETGDGGEGFFIFKHLDLTEDVGGIHIRPTPIDATRPGRWIRLYDGPINAIYFGVVKYHKIITDTSTSEVWGPQDYPPQAFDPAPTNAKQINYAINYIHQNQSEWNPENSDSLTVHNRKSGHMTLFFPDGSYSIEHTIKLQSQVSIIGGQWTNFSPRSFKADDGFMFEMAEGPITQLNFENIVINSPERGLGGIRFKSVIVPDRYNNAAGLWHATFKNLYIKCAGHGIVLEGGTNFQGANQYLLFESINVVRSEHDTHCLLITGELDNTTFLNCNFEAPFDAGNKGPGLQGANIFVTGPSKWQTAAQASFINCSTGGHVTYGFYIQNASNVNLDGCWFESTDIAVEIQNSTDINIQNCRFANAAGQGTLPNSLLPDCTGDPNCNLGRCIGIKDSVVNIENNYTVVSPNSPAPGEEGYNEEQYHLDGQKLNKKQFILAQGDDNTINARNNTFSDYRISETFGITQHEIISTISNHNYDNPVSATGIDIKGKKLVFVKVSDKDAAMNQISRINSTVAPGETIFIRADGGPIQFNGMDPIDEHNGKNIFVNWRTLPITGSPAGFTILNGQAATFIKIDGINGYEKCIYQLVSISN